MPQVLKPLCLTQVGRIPFRHFQPSSLWGNKNWAPQYKDVKVGKFWEQNWLHRLQMVQFECPRHSNPCVSLRLGEIQFHIFSLPLSGVIRIGLSSIRLKKLENLGNTIGLTGCKWFSLNAPGARVMHLLMAFTFEAYYSYPPSERRLAPRRACRAY